MVHPNFGYGLPWEEQSSSPVLKYSLSAGKLLEQWNARKSEVFERARSIYLTVNQLRPSL